MPSVSKKQQAAAAIAFKAKIEGKINDLPKNSSSRNMANSMTVKELEKFASTKRKDLPNEKNESIAGFNKKTLKEIFEEEMLGTEEAGEEISSDKNRKEQLKDAGNETEHDTGWDEYDEMWDSKAATNPTQGGNATGMNSMGVARVGFENKTYDKNSLDLLFEHDYEYKNDYSPGERTSKDLVGDFNCNYQVDPRNKKDLDVAREAIEKASEILNKKEGSTLPSVTEGIDRWQKLAGIFLTEKKTNKKWMKNATNPKEKGELSKKLGIPEEENIPVSVLNKKKKELQKKGEGDKKLSKADRDTLSQIIFALNAKKSKKKRKVDEAMLGGVSNGAPDPGHRAKMNEAGTPNHFTKKGGHKVDLSVAKEELAKMAFDVAERIENMHLDNSDRKISKMNMNKLENIYRHLEKLIKISN